MATVHKGDTVLVTIRTYEASSQLVFDNKAYMQTRLQQSGFRVLAIDDSALGFFGGSGDLLVTVQPVTSDYGAPEDIGSIVRGAAEVAGYGGRVASKPVLISAQVVAQAGTPSQPGPVTSADYERNLGRGLATQQQGLFGNIPNEWLLIGAVGLGLLIFLKSR